MTDIANVKITDKLNWRDIPIDQLLAIQKVLDDKPSFTLAEASIYWQLSIHCIRSYIKKAKLYPTIHLVLKMLE